MDEVVPDELPPRAPRVPEALRPAAGPKPHAWRRFGGAVFVGYVVGSLVLWHRVPPDETVVSTAIVAAPTEPHAGEPLIQIAPDPVVAAALARPAPTPATTPPPSRARSRSPSPTTPATRDEPFVPPPTPPATTRTHGVFIDAWREPRVRSQDPIAVPY